MSKPEADSSPSGRSRTNTTASSNGGGGSPRSPRRVTFSETLFYDEGLVPVRSGGGPGKDHHDYDDGGGVEIELGEIKNGKATAVEEARPAPAAAATTTRMAKEDGRGAGNEDHDRVCGLRRRTVLVLSIVAALIIGALLGGIAGGLIAKQKVMNSSGSPSNYPQPAPSNNPFPTTERSQPPVFPTTAHAQPTDLSTPGSRSGSPA